MKQDDLWPELKGLLDPLQKIKFVERQGWKQRGVKADTIAAHVLDAVLVGWYLADKEGGDKELKCSLFMI